LLDLAKGYRAASNVEAQASTPYLARLDQECTDAFEDTQVRPVLEVAIMVLASPNTCGRLIRWQPARSRKMMPLRTRLRTTRRRLLSLAE
jgi:hypothetical protein